MQSAQLRTAASQQLRGDADSLHTKFKAVQLDRVPIETDVSVDPVLKRAGAGSQATPLQPPVNGHVAYDKLSGKLSISRAVPVAMLGFTQGEFRLHSG